MKTRVTLSSGSLIGLGGMAGAIAARAVKGGNAAELVVRDAAKAKGLPPRSAAARRPGHSALPRPERRRSRGGSQRACTS
jgi:hypothetical protein